LRLFDIPVSAEHDSKDVLHVTEELRKAVEQALGRHVQVEDITIVRKSIDARRKGRFAGQAPRFAYVVDVTTKRENEGLSSESLHRQPARWPTCGAGRASTGDGGAREHVAVVGSGPAGLFACLELVAQGLSVTLIERGQPVEKRGKDIGSLFVRRRLNPESNLCYGEGGAGTYSDGKLATGIGRNHEDVRRVLETFVRFGAPESILVSGAPHLGSDRLFKILQSLRNFLKQSGVTMMFSTRVDSLDVVGNAVQGLDLCTAGEGSSYLKVDKVVLAVGHSARHLYEQMATIPDALIPKTYAMGFRVEHPQEYIDQLRYGEWASRVQRGRGPLPVASYKLTAQVPRTHRSSPSGKEAGTRACYSFCMCPGGQVVPTSVKPSELCINGMSFSRRNSKWANSGIVVPVEAEDLEPYVKSHGTLAGLEWQREVEERAASLGGGDYVVPVQRLTDFLDDMPSRPTTDFPSSSYRLGIRPCSLNGLYTDEVTDTIRRAFSEFEKQLPGFISANAVLHAAETRTSSPVCMAREPHSFESVAIEGVYPAGEGAGYAGGIVSAAVDGMRVAKALASSIGLPRPEA